MFRFNTHKTEFLRGDIDQETQKENYVYNDH